MATVKNTVNRVYYLPNLDGVNSAIVCAQNQKEACRLMGCTLGEFRRFGGRAVPFDFPGHDLCQERQRQVFIRAIGTKDPWRAYGSNVEEKPCSAVK